jgi:GntR family transcriptional regulator of arabinose operon
MTKHQLIRESLLQRIESGDLQPGDRLPTDAELVREFGVSRPTVARAVGELERNGLVRRRRGSGTFVRQTNLTQLFGLLIPGLGSTEIFEPICGEIARLAQGEGHSVLWGGTSLGRAGDPDDKERLAMEICEQFATRRVSGVFFAPLELTPNSDRVNQRVIERLTSSRIPVVLLDRDYLPYPSRSEHDLVGVDNVRLGLQITRHLIERGCRRPMFLARPDSASTIDMRGAGFADALRLSGLPIGDHSEHRIDPDDTEAVRGLMERFTPDAILCGNDATAARLMHTLDEIDVRVPEDVLVAGIDDVRYAELLRVPLTTMHQPCAAIGEAAFRTMLERVERPDQPARDVLLKSHLVVRASTGGRPGPGGGNGRRWL